MLIDSHCHLNHESLFPDVEGCLSRARNSGVSSAIVVGYDLPSSETALCLARDHGEIFATAGIHPHDAKALTTEALAAIESLASDSRVVAIGEIGLDFHHDHSPREAQRAAFAEQLALAQRLGLPVVVHCREAYPEVLDLLEELPTVRGVMHCWAGTVPEAERALRLGWHLGFGGVITFKSAESVRDCLRLAATDRILLETDSPYLAPAPHRGKRNEPALLSLVAAAAASILGTTIEELAAQTTRNAEWLFMRSFAR
jgi:TatD DNase family protein